MGLAVEAQDTIVHVEAQICVGDDYGVPRPNAPFIKEHLYPSTFDLPHILKVVNLL